MIRLASRVLKSHPERANEARSAQQSRKKKAPGHRYRDYEHSSDPEHRTAEQFNWRRNTVLSFITTIAAIVAAVFAFNTYVQTKRQADIAEKGSRPYVLPVIEGDHLRMNPGSGPPNNPRQNPNSYSAVVGFHNYGLVPATVTQTEVIITTTPIDDEKKLVNPKSYLTNGIVSSSATFDQEPYFMQLQPGVASNLAVGNGSLFIQGKIFYTDVSGETFHTFFCYLQPTHTHDIRYVLQRVVGVSGCVNEIK